MRDADRERGRDFDPVLARLVRDAEAAQAALRAYLQTGLTPPHATTIVEPGLERLVSVAREMRISDDALRRIVLRNRLGRKIGRLVYVDRDKLRSYLERHAKIPAAKASTAAKP